MKKKASETKERLQKVLMQDKTAVAEGFIDLLKSDVTELLKNYFDLLGAVEVSITAEGNVFEIKAEAKADGVKRCGRFVSHG